ncbi:MAG: flagellar export protein FliJ [Phycisphaeraceae bacterium]|nr:flagellar export protein FliJ [Phycisphaeraceae bacterium]
MPTLFRFRLQTLLNARREAEDRAQRELAVLQGRKQAMLNELRSMRESIHDARHELNQSLRGRVVMEQVGRFARFTLEERARAQGLVSRLAALEREVVEARGRLLEAMKQRKALELLRDRQKQEWLQRMERRQTEELDELGTQGHLRQSGLPD